jgi:regulator of protease activity HflC (stomatin/prohibitin superfamily)
MPAFLTPINEEFSLESFRTWAKRKFSGYDSSEIDYIARKVSEMKTQEARADILRRIEDSLKDATDKFNKVDDTIDKKLIKDHIEVLKKLKHDAESYDPLQQAKTNQAEKEKKEEAERKEKEELEKTNKEKENRANNTVRLDV